MSSLTSLRRPAGIHPARAGKDHERQRIGEFLDSTAAHTNTPFLVLDTEIAENRFLRLSSAFPEARIYYAVKANPEPALIRSLVRLGASFDVASRAEIDLCLAQGAKAEDLSYGNTIKKASDIVHAYALGVRMFVFDSEAELDKLIKHAPGASVFCRLLINADADDNGALWPLGRKFGCSPEMAAQLLLKAREHGMHAMGLSFHVGSQQMNPSGWEGGIALADRVFAELAGHGLELELLNLGGGFPVEYNEPVPAVESFVTAIRASLTRHFGTAIPTLCIEPGRYIVAEAGVLRTEVVLVSQKAYEDSHRWVYLDAGRFGGLAESEGEAIRYRLTTRHDEEGPSGEVVLAGPTCDSADILYQHNRYSLPLALRSGDHVDILACGAYTTTYSSVGFNGFAPLPTFCIGDDT